MTVSIARLAPTTSTRVAHEQPHSFAGFTRVLRFIVRRDRVRAPVWVSSVLGVVIVGAASVVAIYETPEDLQSYAVVAQADAAIKAITGPGYGLHDPTQGAVVMNEMSMFTLVGVALMCIFMVIRHTRAEEETDRAELVRAAPIGRHAALAATMLWVGSIVFAIGVGTAIGYSFWLPVAARSPSPRPSSDSGWCSSASPQSRHRSPAARALPHRPQAPCSVSCSCSAPSATWGTAG